MTPHFFDHHDSPRNLANCLYHPPSTLLGSRSLYLFCGGFCRVKLWRFDPAREPRKEPRNGPDIGSLLQPPVPEFREWAMAAALRPVPHRLCCRFSEIWRDPHQESKTLVWDHTPRNSVWDWKRAGFFAIKNKATGGTPQRSTS